MSSLAPILKPEERIMLSIYYAGMKMKPAGGGTPEQRAQGKKIFEQVCAECHGADGKGSEGYARVAGQNPQYTATMLKGFKGQTGKRVNPWMTAVSMRLSDEEIDAVSMYLANLE
jgi:cytochrome c553